MEKRKEIKEINKKAGGRKPDPKVLKDAEYHKFDTGKIFKDDKLLKLLLEDGSVVTASAGTVKRAPGEQAAVVRNCTIQCKFLDNSCEELNVSMLDTVVS